MNFIHNKLSQSTNVNDVLLYLVTAVYNGAISST